MHSFRILSLLAVAALLVASRDVRGQQGEDKSPPIRVALIGDSTVASYATPPADRPTLTGWGQVLGSLFNDNVMVANHAASGRSSKSFLREGRWKPVLDERPRYVFIQFGHNDQPGKGDRTTDPDGDYRDNLKQYLREARQIDARPVLVTPVARRTFQDGKLVTTLQPYADAMKAVGRETDTPVIDLHAASVKLYERLGDEGSASFSPSAADRTHFSRQGALAMARLVAAALPAAVPELAALLKLSLAGDFGEPRVIVAAPADESIAHLSWPKVVCTPDGTMVTAYIAGRFHGTHGEGCPAVSVSHDRGRTFTPPQILKRYSAADEFTSAGNVAMGVTPDGAVVLLSMAFSGDKANTIDGWRSSDSGRTWTPVDVSTLARNQTGSVYGNVMTVPDKGLAVCGHFRAGSTTHQQGLWLAWSSDDGKSWGRAQRITETPLVEPAVVFGRDKFIGLIRTRSTDPYYVQITSNDLGETWQSKQRGLESRHPDGVKLPSPCLVVDPQQPGHLYALASERHDRGSLLGRIVLWEANDRELDWKEVGEVARFPRTLAERRDITYGWMAPLESGRWFVVFYCGQTRGPSDIYGLEIELASKGAKR